MHMDISSNNRLTITQSIAMDQLFSQSTLLLVLVLDDVFDLSLFWDTNPVL